MIMASYLIQALAGALAAALLYLTVIALAEGLFFAAAFNLFSVAVNAVIFFLAHRARKGIEERP